MGNSFDLVCGGCGYTIPLTIGPGFMSGPRNPKTRQDVLDGKYGAKPRRLLEENPDAECGWYHACFACRCGNYSSKLTVYMSDMGRRLYRPSRRCSLCHRKMEEVAGPWMPAPCPKCKTEMSMKHQILWD